MTVEVRPATSDRWLDVVAAFGRRGQDPSWCWCQAFVRVRGLESKAATQLTNREAMCEEIETAAVPPGLIAYVAGLPVGWTRVGPRVSFPGVRRNRALARVLSADDVDPEVWWVTCFAVASNARRQGVGLALLDAAASFAAAHGASAVEGHPVDVAALTAKRVSGSAIYTGTKAMFEAASFVEIARTAPTRPVMRRTVDVSELT